MKGHGALVANVMECFNMSLVHVNVCIGRELCCLVPASAPLMDGSIELGQLVRTLVMYRQQHSLLWP
jgi:hypothetical protein